jgi:hypothetical protein
MSIEQTLGGELSEEPPSYTQIHKMGMDYDMDQFNNSSFRFAFSPLVKRQSLSSGSSFVPFYSFFKYYLSSNMDNLPERND